jgi:hypothetical protein
MLNVGKVQGDERYELDRDYPQLVRDKTQRPEEKPSTVARALSCASVPRFFPPWCGTHLDHVRNKKLEWPVS